MAIYTCGVGGERAETRSILRPAGTVEAIVCPVHGLLSYLGFKPTGGTAGVRLPDGTTPALAAQYAKVGARWQIRPPKGNTTLIVGLPTVENPDSTLTVTGYIDTPDWRGWLEDGIWLEEER